MKPELKNFDMKKFRLLSAFLVLLSAVSFTSCETEPVDPVLNGNNGGVPGGGGSAPASFKVDFSGQTYVATSTIATIGKGLISIGGIKGNNGQMVSIVLDGTTEGTYDGTKALIDYNPGNSEYSYLNLNPDTGEDTGSVVITKIDKVNKTVSGTFNFIGWWSNDELNLPSIAFTNGSFQNVPYTDGIDTGNEFFKATVDGSAHSYAGADLAVAVSEGAVNYISINAIGANHKFVIIFPDTVTPGTYTFAPGALSTKRASFTDAGGNDFDVTGGTLTITSNTGGWVKGTFSFPVTNEAGETIHTVSAGSFNVEWDF